MQKNQHVVGLVSVLKVYCLKKCFDQSAQVFKELLARFFGPEFIPTLSVLLSDALVKTAEFNFENKEKKTSLKRTGPFFPKKKLRPI